MELSTNTTQTNLETPLFSSEQVAQFESDTQSILNYENRFYERAAAYTQNPNQKNNFLQYQRIVNGEVYQNSLKMYFIIWQNSLEATAQEGKYDTLKLKIARMIADRLVTDTEGSSLSHFAHCVRAGLSHCISNCLFYYRRQKCSLSVLEALTIFEQSVGIKPNKQSEHEFFQKYLADAQIASQTISYAFYFQSEAIAMASIFEAHQNIPSIMPLIEGYKRGNYHCAVQLIETYIDNPKSFEKLTDDFNFNFAFIIEALQENKSYYKLRIFADMLIYGIGCDQKPCKEILEIMNAYKHAINQEHQQSTVLSDQDTYCYNSFMDDVFSLKLELMAYNRGETDGVLGGLSSAKLLQEKINLLQNYLKNKEYCQPQDSFLATELLINIFLIQGDDQKVIEFSKILIDEFHYTKIGKSKKINLAYISLGKCFYERGDLDQASQYFEKAKIGGSEEAPIYLENIKIRKQEIKIQEQLKRHERKVNKLKEILAFKEKEEKKAEEAKAKLKVLQSQPKVYQVEVPEWVTYARESQKNLATKEARQKAKLQLEKEATKAKKKAQRPNATGSTGEEEDTTVCHTVDLIDPKTLYLIKLSNKEDLKTYQKVLLSNNDAQELYLPNNNDNIETSQTDEGRGGLSDLTTKKVISMLSALGAYQKIISGKKIQGKGGHIVITIPRIDLSQNVTRQQNQNDEGLLLLPVEGPESAGMTFVQREFVLKCYIKELSQKLIDLGYTLENVL